MKSPWKWRQHGQCGKWISDLRAAPGGVRRRHGVPARDGLEVERPRPGDVHAGDRLRAAGLPEHGRVGQLRPGQPAATTCRRSSCCPTAGLRAQRPGQLGRRLPAGGPSGDDGPARAQEPDLRPLSAGRGKGSTPAARSDGRELLDRLNRKHRDEPARR